MTTLRARFHAKVVYDPPTTCWLWLGARSKNGYGVLRIGRAVDPIAYAHRVSYTLYFGTIPDGLVIDHLCRTRACVRPDHLEAVTQRENTIRGDAPAQVARRWARLRQEAAKQDKHLAAIA